MLMQFDNTEAALVEKDVGEGKILLFASSLDLEWNNLALRGCFCHLCTKRFDTWFAQRRPERLRDRRQH